MPTTNWELKLAHEESLREDAIRRREYRAMAETYQKENTAKIEIARMNRTLEPSYV